MKSIKKMSITFIAIAIALALQTFLSGFDFFLPTSPKGRDKGAEQLQEQLMDRKEKISIRYNVDDFNRFLAEKEFTDIWEMACEISDNDPASGDFLYTVGDINFENEGDGITTYKLNNGSDNIVICFEMEYRTTKEQDRELQKKAKEILDSLHLENDSDYEKVRKIYNYICSNVTYDYDHWKDETYELQYTAYAAACQNKAVCSGIANLFYYLAKSAGLDVRIQTNDTHAWNLVQINDKYYYVDATWDLGKDETSYEYFLKGRYDFEQHSGPVSFEVMGTMKKLVNVDLHCDMADYGYLQAQ